jgi:hypothetical protein
MNELEKNLAAAKQEMQRLDAVRNSLPDDASDADYAAANKSYYAAIDATAKAQVALTISLATPSQLAAMEESREINARQLAACRSLAAKDAAAPGIPQTQKQLDDEFDAQHPA